MEFRTTIGENGRINLPARVRKELHINIGDQIILTLENEGLRLLTLKTALKHFQGIVKEHNPNNISLVDSLKQARIEDSEHE